MGAPDVPRTPSTLERVAQGWSPRRIETRPGSGELNRRLLTSTRGCGALRDALYNAKRICFTSSRRSCGGSGGQPVFVRAIYTGFHGPHPVRADVLWRSLTSASKSFRVVHRTRVPIGGYRSLRVQASSRGHGDHPLFSPATGRARAAPPRGGFFIDFMSHLGSGQSALQNMYMHTFTQQ